MTGRQHTVSVAASGSVPDVPCSSLEGSAVSACSAALGGSSCWSAEAGAISALGVGISGVGSCGVAVGSTGVAGVASLGRLASRFFSSVRKKTRTVVRRDLCGVQSSPDSGECSQIGHEEGSLEWPAQSISKGAMPEHSSTPTSLAYRLLATWQSECVDC